MTSRRLRIALAILLSALLLSMQREASVHALTHFVTKFYGDTPAAQVASDEPCAECALLAAGSSVLTADGAAVPACACVDLVVAPASIAAPPARPAYYRSRAPPRLA